MKRLTSILKITGLIILACGVMLSLFDLLGWYTDPDKVAVLDWANTSGLGLGIDHPGAKKFMEQFPPPNNSSKKITHLTKQVLNSALGGNLLVSVNYMYSDATRSAYVANLEDIKDWVKETPYPWIAWLLSAFGFIEVLSSYILDNLTKKSEPAALTHR